MSMFHVGQQIVCINDIGPSLPAGHAHPVRGCVYTIRDIIDCGDRVCLTLEEIVNPIRRSGRELCFKSRRFRPVKPTSIEVFHQLLSPIHERETV